MTADDLEHMAGLLGDPEVMAYYANTKNRAEALDPGNVASQRVAEKIGLALEKELDRHGRRMRIDAGRISLGDGPGSAPSG